MNFADLHIHSLYSDGSYSPEEIVRRAYELNVHANNDPTIPYTGAILERWYEAGLRTPEEIDAEIAAEAERRRGPGEGMGSFDTDDYFAAALQRSFQEDGSAT